MEEPSKSIITRLWAELRTPAMASELFPLVMLLLFKFLFRDSES